MRSRIRCRARSRPATRGALEAHRSGRILNGVGRKAITAGFDILHQVDVQVADDGRERTVVIPDPPSSREPDPGVSGGAKPDDNLRERKAAAAVDAFERDTADVGTSLLKLARVRVDGAPPPNSALANRWRTSLSTSSALIGGGGGGRYDLVSTPLTS